MSQWEQLQMDAKIRQILEVPSHNPNHHFGRPFLTSYQIAISFQSRFPQDFQVIGMPIGGMGIGQQNSLSQYIAHELSERIKNGDVTDIEGRFLHRAYLHSLEYKVNNQIIEASSRQGYDLSMFRLID